MSPRDARAAARRQLGRASAQREEARDAWGFPAVDARAAGRALRAARARAVAGVHRHGDHHARASASARTAMMFAVIDRLMFRPFPYMRDPGTVHGVYLQTTYRGRSAPTRPFHIRASSTFSGERTRSRNTPPCPSGASPWERGRERACARWPASARRCSSSLMRRPALGRYFTPAEDVTPLGALVVVVGHAVLESELGGRDVIGERLRIGTLDYTIIGVAPPGFVGTIAGRTPDFFIPITTVAANMDRSNAADYFTAYRWDWTEVLVRRKPGVSVATASRRSHRRRTRRVAPFSGRRIRERFPIPSPGRARSPARCAAPTDPTPDLESRGSSGWPAWRRSCCSSPAPTWRTSCSRAFSGAGARSPCVSRSA